MIRIALSLAGLLVAAPLLAEEPASIHQRALERTATLVAARGDDELTAAFARLRAAGVLKQLLEAYDQARAASMEEGFPGDGDGGFADPEVEIRCQEALRRHFVEEGMGDEGVRFSVLRPHESRPGWFHCEAEVPGEDGSFYDCYVVNPASGEVEPDACG